MLAAFGAPLPGAHAAPATLTCVDSGMLNPRAAPVETAAPIETAVTVETAVTDEPAVTGEPAGDPFPPDDSAAPETPPTGASAEEPSERGPE